MINKLKSGSFFIHYTPPIAEIQPNLSGNGLDWLCYLAGNFQTALTIFLKFSGYFFKIFQLKTTNHNCPHIFDPYYFCYRWCDLYIPILCPCKKIWSFSFHTTTSSITWDEIGQEYFYFCRYISLVSIVMED